MNIEDRDQVLRLLKQIKEYDITQEIAKQNKTKDDLYSLSIGRYPIHKFVQFFDAAISQLEQELQTDNFYFYPIHGKAQPIAGIDLVDVLTRLINNLKNNQIHDLETLLNQLITYEYYFGFWLISRYKRHSVYIKDIKNRKTQLDFLIAQVITNNENLTKKTTELEKLKNEFFDFVNNRRDDINQIVNNVKKSNSDTIQITEILAKSQKTEQQIVNINKNQREKFKDIEHVYMKKLKEFEDNSKKAEEQIDILTNTLKNAKEQLKLANEDIEFVKGKKEDIVRLTGMAADGALGTKFNDREKKLQFGLKFWRWAVPIITIIAILWVILVFTLFKVTTENLWVCLGINLFKTVPAFFLMGFVFKQYVKERNFQEEYAFKAAVAMTITAYSDLLEGKDEEFNSSRQQMILNAINEVHKSPKIQSEKDGKISGFNKDYLKETINQLKDLIKEIKA
ncbi:MAG: hypothetical protein K8S16_00740 [Bacteroidales bacterium]|nr:hypothetical protein [Bacteroidales bacterium]